MAEINWTEDSLEELLEKSIGDIREMLAHEENGWIETDDYEDDDYEDDEEEDYEEDEDSEEDEDWDDDEDTPSDLSEEEALACSIASDINCGNYTLDTIRAFYNSEVIDRVEELLD